VQFILLREVEFIIVTKGRCNQLQLSNHKSTVNIVLTKKTYFKVKSFDLKLTVEEENNGKLHLIITTTNLSPLLRLK
jgi:hypothetical protein